MHSVKLIILSPIQLTHQILIFKSRNVNMKRLLLFSLLFSIFSANSFAFSYADFIELEEASTPEDMDTSHLRSSRKKNSTSLSVDVYMRNFTDKDKVKVHKAAEILETVMNSQEFKERVLNFTFKGEKQFYMNNGLSNKEIYAQLMTGEEVLMPNSVGIMNFDLSLYRSKNPWSKVKGYTKSDTMRIWMNKKFFRKSSWTSINVAGNMAHEWVHKMGYGHDYRHNADRPYTVPYAIGYIVGDVAKEMGFGSFR